MVKETAERDYLISWLKAVSLNLFNYRDYSMKKQFIETISLTQKNQFYRNIYKIKKLKVNKNIWNSKKEMKLIKKAYEI